MKVIESPRRPGDPPALYADSRRAQRELGWKVKFPEIESIVATAWKWHSSHPKATTTVKNWVSGRIAALYECAYTTRARGFTLRVNQST